MEQVQSVQIRHILWWFPNVNLDYFWCRGHAVENNVPSTSQMPISFFCSSGNVGFHAKCLPLHALLKLDEWLCCLENSKICQIYLSDYFEGANSESYLQYGILIVISCTCNWLLSFWRWHHFLWQNMRCLLRPEGYFENTLKSNFNSIQKINYIFFLN